MTRAARKPKEKESYEWTGQKRMPFNLSRAVVELEKSLQSRIHMAVAAAGGVMVMRNNVGLVKKGPHWIRYGLGNGSADLIAVVAPWGRFLGIEVKRTKGSKVREDQERWLAVIRRYGGVTGIAKSVEDALRLVEEARQPPEWQR